MSDPDPDPIELTLCVAAFAGHTEQVMSLLKDHPDLNINWPHSHNGLTALHHASSEDHVEVVKLLLAHPDIDVNLRGKTGLTAIGVACMDGHASVAQLLLKDPRVDVTIVCNQHCTPLWWASWEGTREVLQWLIASGKDLGAINQKGQWIGREFTCLEAAKTKKSEAVSLLQRFVTNPAQTRYEVRVHLGLLDEVAAEIFALTVFLCDDLLLLKRVRTSSRRSGNMGLATRFFDIASKLPTELQMILCHRVVGSVKERILSKDSEHAFKVLAKNLSHKK